MRYLIVTSLFLLGAIASYSQNIAYSLIPIGKQSNIKIERKANGYDLIRNTYSKNTSHFLKVNQFGEITNYQFDSIIHPKYLVAPTSYGNFYAISNDCKYIYCSDNNKIRKKVLPNNNKNIFCNSKALISSYFPDTKLETNNTETHQLPTIIHHQYREHLQTNQLISKTPNFPMKILGYVTSPNNKLSLELYEQESKNQNKEYTYYIFSPIQSIIQRNAFNLGKRSPKPIYISNNGEECILYDEATTSYYLAEYLSNQSYHAKKLSCTKYSSLTQSFGIPQKTFFAHLSHKKINGSDKDILTLFYKTDTKVQIKQYVLGDQDKTSLLQFYFPEKEPVNNQILIRLCQAGKDKLYIYTNNSYKWVTGNAFFTKYIIPSLEPKIKSKYDYSQCHLDEVTGNYSFMLASNQSKSDTQYTLLRMYPNRSGIYQPENSSNLSHISFYNNNYYGDILLNGRTAIQGNLDDNSTFKICETIAPGEEIFNKKIVSSTSINQLIYQYNQCRIDDFDYLTSYNIKQEYYNLEFEDKSYSGVCFLTPISKTVSRFEPTFLKADLIKCQLPGNNTRISGAYRNIIYGTIETENGIEMCFWNIQLISDKDTLQFKITKPKIIKFQSFNKGDSLVPAGLTYYQTVVANHYIKSEKKEPTIKAMVTSLRKPSKQKSIYLPTLDKEKNLQVIANEVPCGFTVIG